MLRVKEKNLLGRRSGAPGVQGNVCLDNPGVVIDGMTRLEVSGFRYLAIDALVTRSRLAR